MMDSISTSRIESTSLTGLDSEDFDYDVRKCLEDTLAIVYSYDFHDEQPVFGFQNVRKAASIASIASSDAGDLSIFSDSDSDLGNCKINSDDDSDVEFDRYLAVSASRRRSTYIREHHPFMETKRTKSTRKQVDIEDEYDRLPPLASLTIHCDASTKLSRLGVVESIVGVNAVITAEQTIQQTLDFDSIVFNKDGDAIGVVADIFGPVCNPRYCVRFDSVAKAKEIPVGLEVYFAPCEEQYTKTLLQQQLRSGWNRVQRPGVVAEVEEEEEPVFSDDEKEREYRLMKKAQRSAVQHGPSAVRGDGRKRNRVQFNTEPNTRGQREYGPSSRGGGRDGRDRGNGYSRGGRGAGRGDGRRNTQHHGQGQAGQEQNSWNWNSQSAQKTYRYTGPSGSYVTVPIAPPKALVVPVVPPPVEPVTSMAATSTAEVKQEVCDNPYAEFGCYGSVKQEVCENPYAQFGYYGK